MGEASSKYVMVQVKVQTLRAIRNALASEYPDLHAKVSDVLKSLLFECDQCGSQYRMAAFPEDNIYGGMQCFDCAIKEGQTHVEDLEANREGMEEVGRTESDAIPTLE